MFAVASSASVHIPRSKPRVAQRGRGGVCAGRGGHQHVRAHLGTRPAAAAGSGRRSRRGRIEGGVPRASERRARSRRDHRRGTSARGGSVPVHGDVLAGQRARANVSRRVDAGVRAKPDGGVSTPRGDGAEVARHAQGYARATGSRDRRVGSRARRGRVRGGDARGGPSTRARSVRPDAVARRTVREGRVSRRHRRASGGEILPVETHGVDGAAGGKSPVHRPAGGRARVAVVAGVRVAGG